MHVASAARPSPPETQVVTAEASRLNWLQSLRAVSVLLVLLHHLTPVVDVYFHRPGIVDFFYFGHCGVDVFFVISGFIMYYMYRSDWQRPERFIPFIKRRLIRIYPIYWILTTAMLGMILFMPGEVKDYKRNFFYIIESYSLLPLGYAQGNPIIPAGWTLFHEIKFYLLFSACLVLPVRAGRWWVGGWVALTLLQVGWLLTPEGAQGGISFFFSPYNLQFLSGCLVAHYVTTRRPSVKTGVVALLVGLATLGFIGYFDCLRAMENRLLRILAYGLPATLLVLAATTFDISPMLGRCASRFMVLVGDASYSMYLIHYPVYCVCTLALIKAGLADRLPLWLILSFLVVLAFGASLAFHVLVEKPLIRHLKRRLA